MTTHRRSGYTGQEITDRHRRYGRALYALDLDLVEIDDNRDPVLFVEHKHFNAAPISDFQADVIGRIAFDVPAVVVRYWPGTWTRFVKPLNAPAETHIHPSGWLCTERAYVDFLYDLRGRYDDPLPSNLMDTIDERAAAYAQQQRQRHARPPIPHQRGRSAPNDPTHRPLDRPR